MTNCLRTILPLLLLACGIGAGDAAAGDDSYLLYYFLDIKADRFYSTDADGQRYYDDLKEYKYIETSYLELLERSRQANASSEDIKRFLFLGYAALSRNGAGLSEAFDADFMSVYVANRDQVLSILAQVPALVTSTCHYLGRYFGFEDKHIGELDSFRVINEPRLMSVLGNVSGQQCISTMEKQAR